MPRAIAVYPLSDKVFLYVIDYSGVTMTWSSNKRTVPVSVLLWSCSRERQLPPWRGRGRPKTRTNSSIISSRQRRKR